MATNKTGSSRPWYRNAWPWLFAVLLVAAVAGSIYTISLSLDNAPESVAGGQRSGLIVSGAAFPSRAELRLNGDSVTVVLPDGVDQSSTVHLIVVTEAEPSRFILERQTHGVYAAEWQNTPVGVTEYRLQAADGAWSLSALPVPGRRTLILEALDTPR